MHTGCYCDRMWKRRSNFCCRFASKDFVNVASAKNISKMFNIQTHMDYEGQHKAEKFSRFIITLFGIVGLIWGAIIQQFSQTVYILGAGFLLASIITIPPWPIYRRHPLNWQKPRNIEPPASSGDEGKKKKK